MFGVELNQRRDPGRGSRARPGSGSPVRTVYISTAGVMFV